MFANVAYIIVTIFGVSFIFCVGYITCALLSVNNYADSMLLDRYANRAEKFEHNTEVALMILNKARRTENKNETRELIKSAEDKLLESYEEE